MSDSPHCIDQGTEEESAVKNSIEYHLKGCRVEQGPGVFGGFPEEHTNTKGGSWGSYFLLNVAKRFPGESLNASAGQAALEWSQ